MDTAVSDIRVLYDAVVGGIRVVRMDMGPFRAVFTCNVKLGHCTARFDGTLPFSPDLHYAGGKLCLAYPAMSVPPGEEDEFEKTWSAAREFASVYAPVVETIVRDIENGKGPGSFPGPGRK